MRVQGFVYTQLLLCTRMHRRTGTQQQHEPRAAYKKQATGTVIHRIRIVVCSVQNFAKPILKIPRLNMSPHGNLIWVVATTIATKEIILIERPFLFVRFVVSLIWQKFCIGI